MPSGYDRFTARPKGATRITQYGVAAFEKATISCSLRLVLDHPGGSELINITLTEY